MREEKNTRPEKRTVRKKNALLTLKTNPGYITMQCDAEEKQHEVCPDVNIRRLDFQVYITTNLEGY